MTDLEIIKEYQLRMNLKKVIRENLVITQQHEDVSKRGIVSDLLLDKLDLRHNAKNRRLINNTLAKLGVRDASNSWCISSGTDSPSSSSTICLSTFSS